MPRVPQMDAAGESAVLCRRSITAPAVRPSRIPCRKSALIANLTFQAPLKPRAAASASDVVEVGTASASPVYVPTPSNRELRTPHSGYHFDGTARVFFEGWYFEVSIPESRQSFCFMYSIENPAFPNGMGSLERMMYGHRFTGVGAQILGADDKYICQFTKHSKNFWGSMHEVMLGNTFIAGNSSVPPNGELHPQVKLCADCKDCKMGIQCRSSVRLG